MAAHLLQVGDVVDIIGDGDEVLACCRRAEIERSEFDGLRRLAAGLASTVRETEFRDMTARCEVSGVGTMWLALDALTYGGAAVTLTSSTSSQALAWTLPEGRNAALCGVLSGRTVTHQHKKRRNGFSALLDFSLPPCRCSLTMRLESGAQQISLGVVRRRAPEINSRMVGAPETSVALWLYSDRSAEIRTAGEKTPVPDVGPVKKGTKVTIHWNGATGHVSWMTIIPGEVRKRKDALHRYPWIPQLDQDPSVFARAESTLLMPPAWDYVFAVGLCSGSSATIESVDVDAPVDPKAIFERCDGDLHLDGDVLVKETSVAEAKATAAALPWCTGFCLQEPQPGVGDIDEDRMTTICFKDGVGVGFGMQVPSWRKVEALPQLLTLHVDPEGAAVVVTSMGGEEFANVGAKPSSSLGVLLAAIVAELAVSPQSLRFMFADGRVVRPEDSARTLADLLDERGGEQEGTLQDLGVELL